MARRRGLGRGLDALIQEAPPSGLLKLPITSLRPNRLQPRVTFGERGLEELAESIRSQGIVQPLVVTPEEDGTFSIVAGDRRWRAAQKAGLDSVPAVIREVGGDRELLELALVENLQRSDLDPLEEAEAYLLLQDRFGLSQEKIAARVGKGRTTITNALRLLRLPEEVRELLRAGALTAGQARPLLALAGPKEQLALARRTVKERLSARQIERQVARPTNDPRAAKKKSPAKEVNTAAAEEKLTRRLQAKVDIRRRGRGGVLAIHFHSEEELMRLYDMLIE